MQLLGQRDHTEQEQQNEIETSRKNLENRKEVNKMNYEIVNNT